MGRKSGITSGGYHPQIHKMHWVMAQREWNREQEQTMVDEKRMKAAYWSQRLSNAMGELKRADPQGWERWFDEMWERCFSGKPLANNRDITSEVEARVTELLGEFPRYQERLCRDIYIWQDQFGFFVYSKESMKDALYVIVECKSLEEAESFIKGLPYANCGKGFVLDLLPANALAMIAKDA